MRTLYDICKYTYIRIHVYICVDMYVYIYIYMYVCIDFSLVKNFWKPGKPRPPDLGRGDLGAGRDLPGQAARGGRGVAEGPPGLHGLLLWLFKGGVQSQFRYC